MRALKENVGSDSIIDEMGLVGKPEIEDARERRKPFPPRTLRAHTPRTADICKD